VHWKKFGHDLTVESPNMLSKNENNNISRRLLSVLHDYRQHIFAFVETDKNH